ncbi:hypothetical protein GWI33_006865 [Rhynchophorus ferrugineus]|uniref:Origin recognition complex subunit 6 n=1 Tax=Rhynchophorus ferrugineus TaxID=354439 RepID=A0A834MH15_RHYFE|nr:hypothetical protein GWI33_006865 [Rhynchophorus ferrugineus]
MDRKSLKTTAERLNVYDESVINKAEEYLRVYQSKSSIKTLNDQAKTVLCLDLAARFVGRGFDKETALTLSGLKKSSYQNNLNTIEKLLELDRSVTISDLCVQLGCTSIKDDAEMILNKYKQLDKKIKDLDHPQYAAVATYLACRAKRISVDKNGIAAASRLKPSQWKELIGEFEKFGLGKKVVRTTAKEYLEPDDPEPEQQNIKKVDIEEYEDYEVWKKRILDEAYAALKKEKENDS